GGGCIATKLSRCRYSAHRGSVAADWIRDVHQIRSCFPVRSHQSFIKFARGFDTIVASTIFAAPLIRDAQIASVPSLWWIHEGLVGDHFLKKYPRLGNIFEMADIIATPNEESRRIYQPFTSHR